MLTQNLRHRVTFQRPSVTQDFETGEHLRSWETAWLDSSTELVDVPAQVLTGPGREIMGAGSKQSEDTVRIILRWFPGLDLTWRVLWEGYVYNITSIEYDSTARKEIRLRGVTGLSEGD